MGGWGYTRPQDDGLHEPGGEGEQEEQEEDPSTREHFQRMRKNMSTQQLAAKLLCDRTSVRGV